MNEKIERSYAEELREALASLPVKKKCCMHSMKDAKQIDLLPLTERAGAMRQAAERSKCALCLSHFVLEMFLLHGSVTDPAKRNHLEFSFESEEQCTVMGELLLAQGIAGRHTVRKKQHIYYLKDGEAIADFLAYIGANNAAFDFMNSRIEREFRNNVNRQVNCDTANIGKALRAAEQQTAVIRSLLEEGLLEELPADLKETAKVRLKYPQMSLKELGGVHEPPIGKSGVNHRLAKIMDFAETAKRKRESASNNG